MARRRRWRLPRLIKRADEAAQQLADLYQRVAASLDREIAELAREGKPTPASLERRRRRVAALLVAAERAAQPVIVRMIADGFRGGQEFSVEMLRDMGANVVASEFGPRDKDAVRILIEAKLQHWHGRMNVDVGRRYDDVLRQIALQETAESLALDETYDARRKRLERALNQAGVTISRDGVRLVPINDRNYRLDKYAKMVARTTAREAASHGMARRLMENGAHLVQVDSHDTTCDICAQYEGKTYSLDPSKTTEAPYLDTLPPFHPNCRHVLLPAPVFETIDSPAAGGPDVPIEINLGG